MRFRIMKPEDALEPVLIVRPDGRYVAPAPKRPALPPREET